jgi:hypothetical protein
VELRRQQKAQNSREMRAFPVHLATIIALRDPKTLADFRTSAPRTLSHSPTAANQKKATGFMASAKMEGCPISEPVEMSLSLAQPKT